eukprot:gnl/TRDRNA2_/TRDRNA2_191955_c0_seq1.p1 gnl/TRDRNA2_/TRDRNA2_191955_c0~~gnl/TRDRNA2_/TRDRNA2_191955_c0_seq1.p1  ORF type:complete len:290 (+),score=41.35 gnl/TRDRNA2_/TRDRNA2_191955_c0_seq1:70-939(+)
MGAQLHRGHHDPWQCVVIGGCRADCASSSACVQAKAGPLTEIIESDGVVIFQEHDACMIQDVNGGIVKLVEAQPLFGVNVDVYGNAATPRAPATPRAQLGTPSPSRERRGDTYEMCMPPPLPQTEVIAKELTLLRRQAISLNSVIERRTSGRDESDVVGHYERQLQSITERIASLEAQGTVAAEDRRTDAEPVQVQAPAAGGGGHTPRAAEFDAPSPDRAAVGSSTSRPRPDAGQSPASHASSGLADADEAAGGRRVAPATPVQVQAAGERREPAPAWEEGPVAGTDGL